MSTPNNEYTSMNPIYDELLHELYAERTRQAYAASPGVIGIGQWECSGCSYCDGNADYPSVAHERTRSRPRRIRPPRAS